jgi:DUF1009 family protein
MSKLGIIAGGGDLPAQIVASCRAAGREFCLLALTGQADPGRLGADPHAWVRLGAAERIIRLLKDANVKDLVFVGTVRRPSLAALRPDGRALRFLLKLGGSLHGDDRVMTAIIDAFEAEEGFRVVSPDSLLPGLVVSPGPIGQVTPTAEDEADIAIGIEAARALGSLDVGQAVVVQRGTVLGVEAAEGTDNLIARCGGLRVEKNGGVLVKMAKPQQQQRADPPTIGSTTVRQVRDAGFAGIAIEAGRVLVVDSAAVAREADQGGIFVVGVQAPLP